MLKLTRKLEYALIALRHMQMKGDILSTTKEIADMYTIPRELLAKTLQQMARLKYIDAVQGPKGGYYIDKVLAKINLTQFVEEMEGPLEMVECNINSDCIQLNTCNIRMPINKINQNIRSIFNKINITDITG